MSEFSAVNTSRRAAEAERSLFRKHQGVSGEGRGIRGKTPPPPFFSSPLPPRFTPAVQATNPTASFSCKNHSNRKILFSCATAGRTNRKELSKITDISHVDVQSSRICRMKSRALIRPQGRYVFSRVKPIWKSTKKKNDFSWLTNL